MVTNHLLKSAFKHTGWFKMAQLLYASTFSIICLYGPYVVTESLMIYCKYLFIFCYEISELRQPIAAKFCHLIKILCAGLL